MKREHIRRKKAAKWVGREVCCCDLQHRVAVAVDDGWFVETEDGTIWDIDHCISKVLPDGRCHTLYGMVERRLLPRRALTGGRDVAP